MDDRTPRLRAHRGRLAPTFPRRSRRCHRCGQPAMQQSAIADERNSTDSLKARNAGAQLNDSFQFNRATMVTPEHISTTEGTTFDKQRGLGI